MLFRSATYVINVESNTTQSLAGPPSKDPNAMYAASITALVELDSTGNVNFLPYQEGQDAANAKAAWAKVANVAAAAPPGATSSAAPTATSGGSGSSTSGSGKSSPTSSAGSGSGSGSSGNGTTGGSSKNGAASLAPGAASGALMGLAGVLGAVACLLL